MEKQLAKIQNITMGQGGYQGAQLGIEIIFSGKGWGIATFWGHWGGKRDDNCKWTEESRLKHLGEVFIKVDDLLRKAKVNYLHELIGIPVEVTIDNGTFVDFRILEEVL
jgi:hypothetical protein